MDAHTKKTALVLDILDTDKTLGLSTEKVNIRRQKYGENKLYEKKQKSILTRFFSQFSDFMIIILLICAGVSFVISLLNHDSEFWDPVIILGIVTLNAILGTVQEAQAQKAINSLKKLSCQKASVVRDGKEQKIDSTLLVPGDIIVLHTGELVPADARLISSNRLMVNESSLTGEADDVSKSELAVLDASTPVGDMSNMVFSSTMITHGHATAVVTETGMNTAVGKIASLLNEETKLDTPLKIRLAQIGKTLAVCALILCGLVFVLGLLHRFDPFLMFMTSVSLAVAAIPEGLPAIVTIMLAIGVTKMAKKHALVRRLPAVETLGSASVICSDKTGTLTQNKMTVSHFEGDKSLLLSLGTLCTSTDTNATDRAILSSADDFGIKKDALVATAPKIDEIPFDSTQKRMTTIHRTDNGFVCICKGAFDVLINRCNRYLDNGTVRPMTQSLRQMLTEKNEELSSQALRMLAIAYTQDKSLPDDNLVFVGLLGISDPLRPEAIEAVRLCRRAKIRTIMITGDHAATACAIAKKLQIMGPTDIAITGAELEKMSDAELLKKLPSACVFARVQPEHKARIVKALQKAGEVVAMTGDGVNDAPALKAADIGCAMGRSGTDVARESADIVLTDDNFATIVSSVKLGRSIFENIKKATHFLLSSNIGEIILILFGILFGFPTPLLAIELLWVNLVTDSLPAIALALDPPDALIMDARPIPKNKGFFADGLWTRILLEGAMIGTISLLAFCIGESLYDIGTPLIGRTMAFCTLSISQLVFAFCVRTKRSIFVRGTKNLYLVGAFIIGTILQCGVIIIEPLAKIFKVTPLSGVQWLIVSLLCLFPVAFTEVLKWSGRKK